jgi:hypothetical protein
MVPTLLPLDAKWKRILHLANTSFAQVFNQLMTWAIRLKHLAVLSLVLVLKQSMLRWANINVTTRLLVNSNLCLILKDVLNHAIAWPGSPTGSLKSVSDTLSDEAHAAMDKAVLKTIKSSLPDGYYLLMVIVAYSDGLLDQKYQFMSNSDALIDGNPQLDQMLQVAWRKRQFRAIRNLGTISV